MIICLSHPCPLANVATGALSLPADHDCDSCPLGLLVVFARGWPNCGPSPTGSLNSFTGKLDFGVWSTGCAGRAVVAGDVCAKKSQTNLGLAILVVDAERPLVVLVQEVCFVFPFEKFKCWRFCR